mmetsp:Transcript_159068/g.510125  ORF Transcript_159068/g.510125 Transcript_159068/m.510125 type:complete len:223 (+) Transcript_159068:1362-2030(+)
MRRTLRPRPSGSLPSEVELDATIHGHPYVPSIAWRSALTTTWSWSSSSAMSSGSERRPDRAARGPEQQAPRPEDSHRGSRMLRVQGRSVPPLAGPAVLAAVEEKAVARQDHRWAADQAKQAEACRPEGGPCSDRSWAEARSLAQKGVGHPASLLPPPMLLLALLVPQGWAAAVQHQTGLGMVARAAPCGGWNLCWGPSWAHCVRSSARGAAEHRHRQVTPEL